MSEDNDGNKYFVKFVPFNANTISSLINQEIKFSTVYEFNDFNELHYIPPINFCKIEDKKQFIALIRRFYCLSKNICYLNQHLKMYDDCRQGFLETFSLWLNEFDFSEDNRIPQEYLFVLLQNIAFSSVGIFSISDISIFKDDAAQLMFAHYADNLRGLALIYRINYKNKIHAINYLSPIQAIKLPSAGCPERLFDWDKGDFDNITDFKNKSSKWKYEKEYRIFCKPGLRSIARLHKTISLAAILHTNLIDDKQIATLEKIKNFVYEDKIKLNKINSSFEGYNFRIATKSYNENINEWLMDTFSISDKNNSHYEDIYLALPVLLDNFFNGKITSGEIFCEKAKIVRFYYNKIRHLPYEYKKYRTLCKRIISLQILLNNNKFFLNSDIKFCFNERRDTKIGNLYITYYPVYYSKSSISSKEELEKELEEAINNILTMIEDYNHENDCLLLILPNFGNVKSKEIKEICNNFIYQHKSEISSYLKDICFTDNDKFYHCINLTSEENKDE